MARSRPVRLLIAVLAAALVAAVAAAGAVAAPAPAPPGFTTLPLRLADGYVPASGDTAIQVTITESGCGPRYDHAELAWAADRLTVTLLAVPTGPVRQLPQDGGIACPLFAAVRTVAIPLGQPLGQRAIYDGSTTPPTLVAPAPPPGGPPPPPPPQPKLAPMGFELPPGTVLHRRTTVLRLLVHEGCGLPAYVRTSLRWTRHRLTVTALGRPQPQPPGTVCALLLRLRPVTVRLHHRLRDRALYSGATTPPTRIAPAPPGRARR